MMIGFQKEYTEAGFPVFVSERVRAPRIAFLSDVHYGAPFNGVGGVLKEERFRFMVDTLIAQRDRFDCVVLDGDMACRNGQLLYEYHNPGLRHPEKDWLLAAKEDYFDRLLAAGIPYFAVHASHDSLLGDEFSALFGYENHYAILFGDTAFLCFDLFMGPRTVERHMQTSPTDIPEAVSDMALAFLAEERVKRAYLVVHYPAPDPQFLRVAEHPKVRATVAGHSHYNEIDSFHGKPMLQCGHFSRANMRLKVWGLDFKRFVPTAMDAPPVPDGYGHMHPDCSASGSPWQYRMLECREDGAVESYMVFPAREYLAFSAEGCRAEPFYQEYAEARPSFLGEDAPIDKSYFLRKGE